MNQHLLHSEAEAEFIVAVQHYAAFSSELGGRFYDELEQMFLRRRLWSADVPALGGA